MTRNSYLAAAIALYLDSPDTPPRASRNDWAVAADLYRRGVSIEELAHAIRLATLRRRANGMPTKAIHALAYYRAVLRRLGDDDLHPDYVDYIRQKYEALRINHAEKKTKPRLLSQNPAHLRRH